jgi:hypothetical protein
VPLFVEVGLHLTADSLQKPNELVGNPRKKKDGVG